MALLDAISRPKAATKRNPYLELYYATGMGPMVAKGEYGEAAEYDPKYAQLATDIWKQTLPQFSDILNAANTSARTAGAADLRELGPEYANLIREINPQQTQLYDLLTKRAAAGMEAGERLTPDQSATISKTIRGDWAGRGFGPSLPGGLDEAVALARASDGVRESREGFASGVAGMGNDFYTRPTLASILGIGSSAPGVAGAVMGDQSNAFQQTMGYTSDVYGGNYQGDLQRNIAAANNETQAYSAGVSAYSSY